MQNLLSRLWFLNQSCKQVPLDYTRGIVRWAHPDGYFLNAQGQKVPNDNVSPSSQKCFGGSPAYPKDRASNKLMHLLMALAFYGPRPLDPTTGKTCVCHHLIPDKLDYRPANLLCWLTRAEHTEADRRQRALRKILPDMHAISYERHRWLQDPRTTSTQIFEIELEKLRNQYGKNCL